MKPITTRKITLTITIGFLLAVAAAFTDYINLYLWFEKEFVKPNKKSSIGELSKKSSAAFKSLPETVAIVNGVKITRKSVKRVLSKRGYTFKTGESLEESTVREVTEKLIDDELLFQVAMKNNLLPTEEKVNFNLKKLRDHFKSKEQFDSVLSRMGMTEDDFKHEIIKKLAIEKLVNSEERGLNSIDVMDVINYYNNNRNEFKESESIDSPEVKNRIISILKKRKSGSMLRDYKNRLRKLAKIEVFLL